MLLTKSILALLEKDLTVGSLQVRLAQNQAEVRAAQAPRYQVFYEEMGAKPSPEVAAQKRDFDGMDDCCANICLFLTMTLRNTGALSEPIV